MPAAVALTILLPNFQTEFQTGNILIPLVLGTLTKMDTALLMRMATALLATMFKCTILTNMDSTGDSVPLSSITKEDQKSNQNKSGPSAGQARWSPTAISSSCMAVWNIFMFGLTHLCHSTLHLWTPHHQ